MILVQELTLHVLEEACECPHPPSARGIMEVTEVLVLVFRCFMSKCKLDRSHNLFSSTWLCDLLPLQQYPSYQLKFPPVPEKVPANFSFYVFQELAVHFS